MEGLIRAGNLVSKMIFGPEKGRSVPKNIELFVASLPRTGTASMEVALEILGYNALHGAEIAPHSQFVEEFYQGDKTVDDLFDYIAGQGFDVGGMDLMGHFFRWAADKQHVKVVLPVRSAESWAKSWQMIEPGLDVLFGRPFSFSSRVRQLEPFVRDCMNVSGVSNSDKSLESLKSVYQKYVEEVKTTIPSDRLLVFDLRDGWEPLCKFLGKPIPDQPFPHIHESKTIRTSMQILNVIANTWPVLVALPPLLIVWCCTRGSRRRKSQGSKVD